MDDILFKPLHLGGNAITLKHRVVLESYDEVYIYVY